MKKIAIILFSLGLVVTGAYGFRKLNYWERSAWIFEFNSMERSFEGRGRGGQDAFDRRSREVYEGRREQGSGREIRERSDSTLRERSGREFRERSEGSSSFGPGDRGRGGHGRGDSHRGKKVRLRNVIWFLAVFSACTVVSVYLDRAWRHLRKNIIKPAQQGESF